jgi:DNA-binding NarL/FixJ family response regulator
MTRTGAKKKVLIVDDHPALRLGLAGLLDQEADLQVCAAVGTAREAMAAVPEVKPDIAIIDLSLDDGSGLELIKGLREIAASLPILAFSQHPESLYAERAIRAGARGYLHKSAPVEDIVLSLRRIHMGQVAVSDEILWRMIDRRQGPADSTTEAGPADLLTDRELEIFCLLGQGRQTREIADQLHLAFSTVESYRTAIKEKLGLKSAVALVAAAARFMAHEAP